MSKCIHMLESSDGSVCSSQSAKWITNEPLLTQIVVVLIVKRQETAVRWKECRSDTLSMECARQASIHHLWMSYSVQAHWWLAACQWTHFQPVSARNGPSLEVTNWPNQCSQSKSRCKCRLTSAILLCCGISLAVYSYSILSFQSLLSLLFL